MSDQKIVTGLKHKSCEIARPIKAMKRSETNHIELSLDLSQSDRGVLSIKTSILV